MTKKELKAKAISQAIRCRRNSKFVNRVKIMLGCNICGYKKIPQALQFDHQVKSKKRMAIAAMVGRAYSIETIKKEIRKCKILCANCHSEKTYLNNDWRNKTNKKTNIRKKVK